MRRWLWLGMVTLAFTSTGCFVNRYSPEPNVRMQQLLFESEDLRQIQGEVSRFWMNDQPSHMTYERVHGGIGPG